MRRTCEWARILWHHLPEGRLRVDKRASISPKMCHKSEREKNKQTNKKQKKALPDKGRQLFVLLLLSCFNCVWLFVTLWTVACQAPLSLGFSRQEYPNGLPYPSPRNLPQPGIEPGYPASSASQGDSLLLSHQGSPIIGREQNKIKLQASDKKAGKKFFVFPCLSLSLNCHGIFICY